MAQWTDPNTGEVYEWENWFFVPIDGVSVKNLGINIGTQGVAGDTAGGVAGSVSYGVEITNTFVTGDVTGRYWQAGGLVGGAWGDDVSISYSYATGTVTVTSGGNAGGLVGWGNAPITSSFSTSDVQGISDVGGLAGVTGWAGAITNSYATGNVTATNNTSAANAGGLVGSSWGMITNSYATGDVSAISTNGFACAGGLVAQSSQNITDSFAEGDVTVEATDYVMVGGLVGRSDALIRNSHASGEVRGTSTATNASATSTAGGLVGWSEIEVMNSFASGEVVLIANQALDMGTAWAGGLIGVQNDADIVNSFASGNVSVTAVGTVGAGGLAGGFNVRYAVGGAVLTNSHATGNVTALSTSTGNHGAWSGGLVGSGLSNTIINNYAVGNATSTGTWSSVGGLIGVDEGQFIIRDSFARGNVRANGETNQTHAGGLIGRFSGTQPGHESRVINSYRFNQQTVELFNRAGTIWQDGATNTLGMLMSEWVVTQIGTLDSNRFYIHVSDNVLGTHITGATVIIGTVIRTTNDIGVASFSRAEISDRAQTISVSAGGFRTLNSEIIPDFGNINQFSLSRPGNEPFIDAFVLDNPFRDLTRGSVTFTEYTGLVRPGGSVLNFRVHGGYDLGRIDRYEMLQGGTVIATAGANGVFSRMHVSDFARTGSNNFVTVRAVAADGSQSQVHRINLIIGTPANAPQNLQLNFGSATNILIPGHIPLIGGMSFSADFGNMPLQMSLDGDRFRIGIGGSTTLFDSRPEDQRTSNFDKHREFVRNVQSGGFNSAWRDAAATAQNGISGKAIFNTRASIWGYLEGLLMDDGMFWNVTSGQIVVSLNANLSRSWQTFAGPVPMTFHLSFGASGTIGAHVGIDSNLSFTFEGSEWTAVVPTIGMRGGVGFVGLLEGGGGASASNTMRFAHRRGAQPFRDFHVQGNVYIWYRALFIFQGRQNLTPSGTIWRDTVGVNPFSGTVSTNDFSMDSFSIDDFEVMPRTEPGQWLSGYSGFSPFGISQTSGSYKVVQTTALPSAHPRIVEAAGTRLMLFVTDDSNRDIGNPLSLNRTALVYSIYNPSDSTWSIPLPVHVGDNTADFFFDVASDGQDIWVAWHNSNRTFANNEEIENILAASEIYVARFDNVGGLFTDITRVTGNNTAGTMDSMPRIAINNGNAFVSWLNNDENDLLGMNGRNTIMAASLDNLSIFAEYDLDELYDATLASTAPQTFTVEDMYESDDERPIVAPSDYDVAPSDYDATPSDILEVNSYSDLGESIPDTIIDEELAVPPGLYQFSAAGDLASDVNRVIEKLALYLDDVPVVAYIVDADNNHDTISDRQLVIVNLEGHATTVVSNAFVSNLQPVYIQGNNVLSWFDGTEVEYGIMGGNIRFINSVGGSVQTLLDPSRDALLEQLPDNYVIISDTSGNMAIVYSFAYEDSRGISGLLYLGDNHGWSYSTQLLETSGYVQTIDGVFDASDNLYFAFNMAHETNGDTMTHDIAVSTIIQETDIAIGNLIHSPFDVSFGENLPITFEISNLGQTVVDSFSVQVSAGASTVDSFYITDAIIPGESIIVETGFILPGSFAPQTQFVVTVLPQGLTDVNMLDNTATLTVGHTDLVLTIDDHHYSGSNLLAVVTVDNESDFATIGTLIVRQDDLQGPELRRINLGNISARARVSTIVNMDTAIFDFNGSDTGVLYFEVVANQSELVTANNSDFIPVHLPLYMINLSVAGGGTVEGMGGYVRGSQVTVEAIADSDYSFNGWFENGRRLVGASATYSFTAVANRDLEARFTSNRIISLNPSGTHEFPTRAFGAAPPAALTIRVENTTTVPSDAPSGALTVTLEGENASAFKLSTGRLESIDVGRNRTFTVRPNSGLLPSIYTATVWVRGADGNDNNINERIEVSYTVTKATQTAPVAPAVLGANPARHSSGTPTSVTLFHALMATTNLEFVVNREYRLPTQDDMNNMDWPEVTGVWQPSPEFTGLRPDTQYWFFARRAETTTHLVSLQSPGRAIRTGHETLSGTVTATSVTATAVTLNAIPAHDGRPAANQFGMLHPGQTYPYDIRWQSGRTFSGLQPNTEYRFFARRAQTNTHTASGHIGNVPVTTLRSAQTRPGAPALAALSAQGRSLGITATTATSVTLRADAGFEYAKSTANVAPTNNNLWVSEFLDDNPHFAAANIVIFDNLDPNTRYFFFARRAETGRHEASPASAGRQLTTLRMPLSPSALPTIEVREDPTQPGGARIPLAGAPVFGQTLHVNYEALRSELELDGFAEGQWGTVAIQWLRNGANIPAAQGGTGEQYTVQAADVGRALSVRVTVQHAAGARVSTRTVNAVRAANEYIPSAPTVQAVTHSSITLRAVPNAEFAVRPADAVGFTAANLTWQTELSFTRVRTAPGAPLTNIQPDTEYVFYARTRQTATHFASEKSSNSETVSTLLPAALRPAAPTRQASTATGVTLSHALTAEMVEFGINTRNIPPVGFRNENTTCADYGWQEGSVFNNLAPNTQYFFFARRTDGTAATSVGVAITTLSATFATQSDVMVAIHIGGEPITAAPVYGDVLNVDTNIMGVSLIPDGAGHGTLTYQWLRNGSAISAAQGGHEATYVIRQADVGRAISVRVSVTGASGTFTSARTQNVLRAVRTDVPNAPIIRNATHNTIELEPIPGAQFRRGDQPNRWQTSPRFTGLAANMEYTFHARFPQTATHFESEVSPESGRFRTLGTAQTRPAAPTMQSRTATSITLNPVALTTADIRLGVVMQYGINTVNVAPTEWQASTVFNDLIANTQYFFFARRGAVVEPPSARPADVRQASPASVGRAVATARVNLMGNVSIHLLDENVPIIEAPRFGQTLTAVNAGTLTTDCSNTDPGRLLFQWQRGNTVIAGATGERYTVTQADIGHRITVVVRTSNTTGNVTAPFTAPAGRAVNTTDVPQLTHNAARTTRNSITLIAPVPVRPPDIPPAQFRLEYGIRLTDDPDGHITWQTGLTFTRLRLAEGAPLTNLRQNTSYTFYARIRQTATHLPSETSYPVVIYTGT